MDGYDPLRVLGEGSFGKVYLMRDKKARALVCVKVIKLRNIPRKEREACKKEVDLLRRLNHPNICGYRGSFMSRNKDSLCIVMEFCDGGDLSDVIKKAGRRLFREEKVLHYFVQMALGLHYMHERRILHRDLKTQNIFLLGTGRLVLGDLGICKVLEGTQDFAKTCIGTPYYMSPEIFKNKPYSHKADIWALGCVLYEMTTLKHAFDGSSINQLASKIIKGRYPPISSRYSAHLKDLITAMLQVNANKRPSIERILTLPFIKRHIQDFLSDIVTRPSGGIGDGTKMVKAAAINLAEGGGDFIGEPKEAESLRAQLKSLGMQDLMAKVMGGSDSVSASAPAPAPAPVPASARSGRTPAPAEPSVASIQPSPRVQQRRAQARAQARALNREEERKKAVESALARLRAEREERLQRRNKIGVRGREQMKQPLPSAARGNKQVKQLPRKKSNASNPVLVSNKAPQESRMKRNPSAAAAAPAPAMRRQPSKYIPPAVQQQVSDLDDWEQRRKKEEIKRREKLAAAAAVGVNVEEVKRQPKAQPVVKKFPLSKFAVGPIPQMKRPSNPSRNVRAAARPKPEAPSSSKEDDRKRQMEEFKKLKADKEMLDRRVAAKMAQSKANREEEEKAKEKEREAAKANGAAHDEPKPMLFQPAPGGVKKIKNLPPSGSASQISSVKPLLSERGNRRSESAAALGNNGSSGGNPKKMPVADALADKIVGAAARGAKGVAVISAGGGKAEADNGEDSSDFSDSGDELEEGDDVDDEFEAEGSTDDKENEKVIEEREAELEKELMKATLRCEDLKETLRQCKPETDEEGDAVEEDEEDEEDESEQVFLMDGGDDAIDEEDEEDEDEDEDEDEEEEEEEEEEDEEGESDDEDSKPRAELTKENVPSSNAVHPLPPQSPAKTPPRSNRSAKATNPTTKILADLTLSKAPTPENGRGSISARVRFLQQRCIKVLGPDTYDAAYDFLQAAQEGDEADETVNRKLTEILGAERVKTFGALIDQIVFMEAQI